MGRSRGRIVSERRNALPQGEGTNLPILLLDRNAPTVGSGEAPDLHTNNPTKHVLRAVDGIENRNRPTIVPLVQVSHCQSSFQVKKSLGGQLSSLARS